MQCSLWIDAMKFMYLTINKGYFPPSRVSFGGKIRTRASFLKIPANYTSRESSLTAVYDKNII